MIKKELTIARPPRFVAEERQVGLLRHRIRHGEVDGLGRPVKQERELLFRVTVPGKVYRVYTDGSTEGFGEEAYVENRWPLLKAKVKAVHVYEKEHLAKDTGITGSKAAGVCDNGGDVGGGV